MTCGRIDDAALDASHETVIHDIAALLEQETETRVPDHVLEVEVEVEGVCGACDRSTEASVA